MAPRKNKNLPAKTGGKALAVPDQMALDAQQGASGFENIGADDIAIPFIKVLQALSPEVRGKTKIKGAKEGDFINSVTLALLGNQIILVPCAYEKAYVEWKLREDGGGYIQKHATSAILDNCNRDEKNRNILPNGNQVVDTAYHYCLLVYEDESFDQVVVSLTSTQLKKSRRWNSMALALKIEVGNKSFTPPMYSHTYVAKTVEEDNDIGSWSGWLIGEPTPIDNAELYAAAKKLHDDVTRGGIKTAPPPSLDGAELTPEPNSKNDDDCF